MVELLRTARGRDFLCPRARAFILRVSLTANADWTGRRAPEVNGRFHEAEHDTAKAHNGLLGGNDHGVKFSFSNVPAKGVKIKEDKTLEMGFLVASV